MATFSLAVDRFWPDGNGGFIRQTNWFTVVCWSKLAERVSDEFKKGALVLVDGELQQRSWEDKEGKKKSVVEIRAGSVRRMDFKANGAANGDAPAGAAEDYFGDEDPGAPPAV